MGQPSLPRPHEAAAKDLEVVAPFTGEQEKQKLPPLLGGAQGVRQHLVLVRGEHLCLTQDGEDTPEIQLVAEDHEVVLDRVSAHCSDIFFLF